jgi:hypothetical protein
MHTPSALCVLHAMGIGRDNGDFLREKSSCMPWTCGAGSFLRRTPLECPWQTRTESKDAKMGGIGCACAICAGGSLKDAGGDCSPAENAVNDALRAPRARMAALAPAQANTVVIVRCPHHQPTWLDMPPWWNTHHRPIIGIPPRHRHLCANWSTSIPSKEGADAARP